jgi:serine/threonine protein kinase
MTAFLLPPLTNSSRNYYDILPIDRPVSQKSPKKTRSVSCETYHYSNFDPKKALTIGSGTSSKVYKVKFQKNAASNKVPKVAIKYFSIEEPSEGFVQLDELHMLLDLQDVPHVPRVLYSYASEKFLPDVSANGYYITTPYYGPNLSNHKGSLAIKDLQNITKQLLETLKSLKNKKIIHADIKPSNICFDGKDICLIDFGLAFSLEDGKPNHKITTSWYRAPEIILENDTYSTDVDMWSLGCSLYELYTGEALFQSQTEDVATLLNLIISKIGSPPDRFYKKGKFKDSTSVIDFFNKCQKTNELEDTFNRKKCDDPKKAEELLDLILKMVRYEDRITPQEALNHPFFK